MASHSAFKIRVTQEAYISFFTTIRSAASPEPLTDQVSRELGFPRNARHSMPRKNVTSDWAIFFRQPPAGLPAFDLPSD
jgi:hypothetical protein